MNELLTYYEIFDKSKLQYIIENYEEIKDDIRQDSKDRLTNINIDPLSLVKKYLSKSKPTKNPNINIIKVSYKQTNKKYIGRHYSLGSLSLQNIPREIRHTIAGDIYYDIDIKNAHPEILYQYGTKKELKTKYIKYYIDNREDIFNEYSKKYKTTPDEIKKGFLCILNGAKTFLKMKENDMPKLVLKFKKEVELIQQYIYNNELEYKKLGIINAKNKQLSCNYNICNELGSTMNIMLCDIENTILISMINYLNDNKLVKNKVTLVFDGLMLPKENIKNMDINKLLINIEEHIKNELDYKIKLVAKPMTQGFDTSIKYNKEINNKNDKIIKDDNEAANKILSILDKKIYICNKTLYYKYENKWIDDYKLISQKLKQIIIEYEFIKHVKATREDLKDGVATFEYNGIEYCTDRFETYSADNKGATNILEVLKTKIIINDNLIKNINKSSHNKIFFLNGYHDFSIGKFINNFDNVDTLIIIQRNFKPATQEKQNYIKKKIFEVVFNEDTNEFLQMMARALSGNISDKIWSIIFGGRDAGKSIVQKAINNAFQDYITTINADSLISDSSSGCVAKKKSWAYDFDKHRVAFSNEMEIKQGTTGNGNIIKQICSGGDKLLVRKNNVDEKEVLSQTTLILCANDIAKFEPSDVYEKLVPFSIKTKFVDKITPKLIKENPYYTERDNNIDNIINDEDNIDAITSLILNSYKPNRVKLNEGMNIILDTFTEDNNVVELLFNNFEITGNPKHRVNNDIIKSFLKDNKLNISFSKIVNIFNSKGVKYVARVSEETGNKKMTFLGLIKREKELVIEEEEKQIINNNDDFLDD